MADTVASPTHKKRQHISPAKEPSNASAQPAKATLSNYEGVRMRRQRAQKLGLQQDSPQPVFALNLSPDQVDTHPLINSWQSHRDAIRDGSLSHDQLPTDFQSIAGRFTFLKTKPRGRNGNPSQESKRKVEWQRQKDKRLKELHLKRTSHFPKYAQKLTLEEIKIHPETKAWHQHREKILAGTLSPSDLPDQFKSATSDGLKFKTTGRSHGAKFSNDVKAKKAALYAKAKALGLHRHSPLPNFARKLAVEDVKNHKDIESWHHHRTLLEQGIIKQSQLPLQFRAKSTQLRLRKLGQLTRNRQKRPAALGDNATQTETSAVQQEVSQSDHIGIVQGQKPVAQEAGADSNDPFAFLHTMPLD